VDIQLAETDGSERGKKKKAGKKLGLRSSRRRDSPLPKGLPVTAVAASGRDRQFICALGGQIATSSASGRGDRSNQT